MGEEATDSVMSIASIENDLEPKNAYNLDEDELESLAVQDKLGLEPLTDILREHRQLDAYWTGTFSTPVYRFSIPTLATGGVGMLAGEPNTVIPASLVFGLFGLKQLYDRRQTHDELQECKQVLNEYRVLGNGNTDDVASLIDDTDTVTIVWDEYDIAIASGHDAADLYRDELSTLQNVFNPAGTADLKQFREDYGTEPFEGLHSPNGVEELTDLLNDTRITPTLRVTSVDSDVLEDQHAYAAEIYVGGEQHTAFLGASDSATAYTDIGDHVYTGPYFMSQCYETSESKKSHTDVINEDLIPAIAEKSRESGWRQYLPGR